jgi:hypothetical protein
MPSSNHQSLQKDYKLIFFPMKSITFAPRITERLLPDIHCRDEYRRSPISLHLGRITDGLT